MNEYEIKRALRALLENCAVDQDSQLYKDAAQGLNELADHYELTDKRYAMAIVWMVDDVLSMRPDLTEEQANEVLTEVERQHDASIGISWDTLDIIADSLYPEPEEEDEDEPV